ncbi:uncharacterized protein LOC125238786 [Leguminivora glycinivorella]|uniref:uncharacterized protein LOC125238786 n=1 Tax=Leguminivora glycinivorella TaxID=1035111 RepID=UPI00200FC3AA|nr:uncharacterized protein LOC125238786 [Leguminivora glycinivorella]
MYKMKKPPPVDESFLPKNGPVPTGPVYELSEDKSVDRRATPEKDCDKPVKRASLAPQGPDIVIALTTNNEKKPIETEIQSKFLTRADEVDRPNEIEAEEAHIVTEKVPEIISEERMYASDKRTSQRDHKFPETSDDETPYKPLKDPRPRKTPMFTPEVSSDEQYTNMNKRGKKQKVDPVSEERFFPNPEKKNTRSWARIPQEQWGAPNVRAQARPEAHDYEKEHEVVPKVDQPSNTDSEEKTEDKPASLQHLVNAIGTRMRDIENVVQQMSEKVQPPIDSVERLRMERAKKETDSKIKQPNSDNYNRFPPQQGVSKYLRAVADTTTDVPLYVGDNLNGYFSDPSNNLLRRSMNKQGPKEPQETYMVPIDNDHSDRKKPTDSSAEPELKHKKHGHKKKKSKHGRRKHKREEKKFSRIAEGNAVSVEENDFGKA